MARPSGQVVPLTGFFLDGLTQGSAWLLDGSRTLTYSFWNTDSSYYWDPAVKATARSVFNTLEQYIAVSFVEVTPGGTVYDNTSDISLAIAPSSAPFAGMAAPPDPARVDSLLPLFGFSRQTYPTAEGDIGFNPVASQFAYLQPGQAGFATALHELGHALGLKHPHDDGGVGRPTFSQLGLTTLDNTEWTMMSYGNRFGSTLSSGNPATPSLLDVAALQYLYGANPRTGEGDTVYRITTEQNSPLRTIWDVSGTDTIDASAMFVGVDIDLTGASRPQVASAGSEFRIAYWVTIENATGGSGSDWISGNAAGNNLNGGAGSDELIGWDGDDVLFGGSGDDSLNGGEGTDTAVFNGASSQYAITYGFEETTISTSSAEGADTLLEIEQARFSDGTIVLVAPGSVVTGTSGSDRLSGGGGADIITGLEGSDSLVGGAGADLLVGDDGDDTIDGGSGNDRLESDDGRDALTGGSGDDQLVGGMGDDQMIGNAGLDLILGESGSDYMNGGSGSDALIGGSGADRMEGGGGDDFYNVDNPGDVLIENPGEGFDNVFTSVTFTLPENVEVLFLDEGAGSINGTGNSGINVLIGNGFSNALTGGAGNDIYSINGAVDAVVEGAGGGYDEVYSSGSFVLPENVETLFLSPTGSGENSLAFSATGNSNNNALIGNNVDNLIQFGTGAFNFGNGLGGNDIMIAGSGHDEMLGGSGNDTFRFNAPTAPGASGDFIYDFTIGQDHIQLNAGAFGIGTASNPLVAGINFISTPGTPAPTNAVPTLEYSSTTGYLFYDADGTAAGAPVVLALLNGVPDLHASDFSFF